jgi:hypothetical protein
MPRGLESKVPEAPGVLSFTIGGTIFPLVTYHTVHIEGWLKVVIDEKEKQRD